jgi:hypothetical protein
MTGRGPLPIWAPAAAALGTFLAVYVPAAGRGFIKDDFRWIVESRAGTIADLARPFVDTTGFFRPVVALTFAANEWAFGAEPWGYGATNLLLSLLCAGSVAWLASVWRLPAGACLLAAAIWLLNLHGINMAVLWISGRTALLVVLFSVLAAVATRRSRLLLAALLTFLAMLSKEEAVLLPVPLIAMLWLSLEPGARRRPISRFAILLAIVEAAYFWLRRRSDALTPWSATREYRFSFDAGGVVENVLEYADRGATVAVAAVLLLALIAWRVPKLDGIERKLSIAGLIWLAAGFALTVFLPIRSSLYACLPSVGTALAAAASAASLWRTASPARHRAASIVAVIVALALAPIHYARALPWTRNADLSRSVSSDLVRLSGKTGPVVFVDDASTRVNLASAFGWLMPEAIQLLTGTRREVWLVPPLDGSNAPLTISSPPGPDAFALSRGHLVPIDPATLVGRRTTVVR